jgi:hypothetical protein
MKTRKILDKIYGQDFFLIFDCTTEEYIKKIQKIDKDYFIEGFTMACYTVLEDDEEETKLLFFSKKSQKDKIDAITTISHEVLHFVHDTMQKVGMKLNDETQEAYAYYFEYIQRKVLNNIYVKRK